MEFKEQVLDLLADVAENDVVKNLMSKYSKEVLLIHSNGRFIT